MDSPSVPGVEISGALGRPGTWRGRTEGGDVDVTVLAVDPDPDRRRAALAALSPLTGLGAQAVILCRDGVAVICPAQDGTPLADLPQLELGHAVHVGTAVAQVLLRAHARGIAWGGDLSDVLVTDGGEVLMPLHGVGERRLAGEPATAAADADALRSLLARRCPGLPPLPDDLPALRRRLRRVARPRRPVLAGQPPPAPRARWLVAALPLALVAAALVGWVSARRPAPHADVVAAAAPDWAAVVGRLDRARSAALAGSGPMTAADAPGSPALEADLATAAALLTAAPRTVPPTPVVRHVTVLRPGRVTTLQVTDTLRAYDYRNAAGRVVGSVPARGPHTWTVTVVTTPDGWRVREIR